MGDLGSRNYDAMYARAVEAQWDAEHLVWNADDIEFGAPLLDTSAFARAARAGSPFATRGAAAWDGFRWELHTWLVSQFLYGEHAALAAAERLAGELTDPAARRCVAIQATDERRHIAVFDRYCRERLPALHAESPPLRTLIAQALGDRRWDMVVLGMQLVVEPLALGAFRLAETTLHGALIRRITALAARDESRHVALGGTLLAPVVQDDSEATRREREEFLLEAIELMSCRFLLEELWPRLDVAPAVGVAWARHAPMLVGYRQLMFAKVISALTRLGLISARIRAALERADLLGHAGGRTLGRELAR